MYFFPGYLGKWTVFTGRAQYWERGDALQIRKNRVLIWDNYKDYTYLGTLDGSYQHTLIVTGTRLRPLQATFLGHILGTKPAKKYRGLMPFKTVFVVILGLLKFVKNSPIKPCKTCYYCPIMTSPV